MNGCVQLLEVLWLVLQVDNFLLEVELFLDQSDPCSLCKGASAGRQATEKRGLLAVALAVASRANWSRISNAKSVKKHGVAPICMHTTSPDAVTS